MTTAHLLHLLQLADATLPIGSFSHSSGLETYVQQGRVCNGRSAREFVSQMLRENIHFTDAALVALTYDAAQSEKITDILAYDEECTAVKLPKETRMASQKLGGRLLKIFYNLMPSPLATCYHNAVKRNAAPGNYCIVFGLYASIFKIDKQQALAAFYYNAATAMVTNAVKLIPLGQQEGQQILFSMLDKIEQLVATTMVPDRNKIGTCCPGFDIRCMQHEKLYSRLYMS